MIIKTKVPIDKELVLDDYIDRPVGNDTNQIGTVINAEYVGELIELTIKITDKNTANYIINEKAKSTH